SLRPFCAKLSSCKILSVTKCPANLPYESLKNSGDAVNEYCMLGCASSVCGATTLQTSNASEIVDGAVAQCTNACSHFCTKGSANAVETA
nr:thionin variant Thi2Ca7 - Abyssinian crambe [Crambe hispanica subsp. abyssinica]